ncbi:MAG: LysR family transcriptional regulator [Pseudomonadota bacterium]
MRNFVRVVDAGSITRAADSSHVAKSAISRRLSDLETRLKVQLINRTTRRMTLTDAGQRYYDESVRLLGELEEAEALVVSEEAALTGKIRLAGPTVFGTRHLGPAINEFLKIHTEIEFELEFNDRHIDLVEEGFDLAIRIAELKDSRLMARRLAPITGMVLASPDYWQTHGLPKKPADLEQHRGIHYAYVPTTWRYKTPRGKNESIRVPAYLLSNNGDYIASAARDGLGVIKQPNFICHEDVEAGRLIPVFEDHHWFDLNVWAVYPNTRHLPKRIRVLIDFLAERWGEDPVWQACCAGR